MNDEFKRHSSPSQHVAIIMDGNNRFAKKMHLAKGDGHREGKNT
jgi:undecaprenyl diphosphate synthase